MDDLKNFLPGGPNFDPFESLASPVAFGIGIALALAALLALGAVAIFLVRMGMAYFKGDPHKASAMGKSAAVSFAFLLGITVFFGLVVTVATAIGEGIV